MFLFRCIEKGRYMSLFLLASAMEMTKYEVTEPQHHNQQRRLPKRIKTSRHFTLCEQLRWTFLASQETYLKLERMITCVY